MLFSCSFLHESFIALLFNETQSMKLKIAFDTVILLKTGIEEVDQRLADKGQWVGGKAAEHFI